MQSAPAVAETGLRRAANSFSGGVACLALAALALLAWVAPPARAATQTSTFTASADAYVSQAKPGKKTGSTAELRVVGGASEERSYIRFDVAGLPGPVSRVTLRTSPNVGPTAYNVRGVAPGAWAEGSISWNTAPAIGTIVGSSTVASDGWTVADATGLVSGNGAVSVALTTTSTAPVSLASRETGLRAPQLVVETVTPPSVTLVSPAAGASVNDSTPTFSGSAGTAAGDSSTVTVWVYPGTTASGSATQTLTATRSNSSWSVDASPALADGTYTVQASQSNANGLTGTSAPSSFAVDTTPPAVTLTAPANGATVTTGSPTLSGGAGTAAGDSQTVKVELYAGSSASGTPLQTLSATRNAAGWSVQPSSALANGTYTARASQTDAAGNSGASTANTFTVDIPPAPSGAYRNEILLDAPRAYWRLGETSGTVAADQSANKNTGGYVNGVSLGQPGALGGDVDTAASFDGVNDYMTVPQAPSLDITTGATVETWLKRSKSGWQVVLGKPGNGQSKLENYALWINSSNNLVAYFGNGSAYASVFSSKPVDTSWHHVVATYDNTTARIYIDGVLDATSTSSVRLTPNSQALNVARETFNANFFGGSLDEPAVYGAVLSQARIQKHYETGKGPDTTPPAVVLTTPSSGSSTIDTTPTFAGGAAITGTDLATVTVKVYAGPSASGTLAQTLSTSRFPTGSWTVDSAAALPQGTYTATAEQADSAGNVGRSVSTFSVVARPPVGSDAELVGAGDIAYCDDTGDEATSVLLDAYPAATVFTLGDNAYERGTPQEFSGCYAPTWGRAKARTRPSLGDHDYADGADADATGYFGYFGSQLAAFGAGAADPDRGYYSYEAGSWHVVVLNAVCGGAASGCSAATQLSWLNSDLAAHPTSCTMAVLSAPRWSSGSIHGNNQSMQSYWQALAATGAELVLSGDDHDYERFAPQDSAGVYDANGLRQFVVGTGGRSHYPFAGGVVRANSEARNDSTFGILRLVLRTGGYEWEFVPEAGRSFTDSGSATCHS